MTKQDVYIAKMKAQLDELNVHLRELEAKAQDAQDSAQATYQEQMARLREQSKLASAKLDEMSAAAEGSWHKMVAEMEKLQAAFTKSFHYFKSRV